MYEYQIDILLISFLINLIIIYFQILFLQDTFLKCIYYKDNLLYLL